MLNKRELQYRLSQLRHVKTWQLLVILFFGVLLAASFLRLNNLGMVERRDAVIAADQAGDDAAIKKSLVDLQSYVARHMNASLGNGVYLQESYERDRETALQAATTTENPNSAVYQQASVECRARFQGGTDSFRNDYVQCVVERVSALSGGQDTVANLQLPTVDNYRYTYVSPLLSFDIAGLTVLFCVVILVIVVSRLLALGVLKLLLKQRFKSI